MKRKEFAPLRAAVEELYLYRAETRRSEIGDLADLHEAAVAETIEAVVAEFRRNRSSIGSPKREIARLSTLEHNYLRQIITEQAGQEDLAETIGAALEQLRGRRLVEDSRGALRVQTSPDQRGKGVYYTPVKLAEEVARPAVEHALRHIEHPSQLADVAFVDPAVGGGVFLLVALRLSVAELLARPGFRALDLKKLRSTVAENCLYGVDIDPTSVATTRALILAEIGAKGRTVSSLDKHLHVADAVASGIEAWRSWFPERAEGFSAVLTNPPWSKLRPLRHEYFEHVDARVRSFQGQELGVFLRENIHELVQGSWEGFVQRNMALSSALRKSVDYPISNDSSGDPDLYKYFAELSVALLRPGGVAGLLLPSGFLRAQGGGGLRRHLLESGQIVQLTEYINKRKIFDIHSMYRFVALAFVKGASGETVAARFGVTDLGEESSNSRIELSREFLGGVGGADHLFPEVRTTEERDLLKRLFRRGKKSESIAFKRELDMTNDSHMFIDLKLAESRGFEPRPLGYWEAGRTTERLLPVYEGRMIQQFDSVAKEYRSGHGRSARWEVPVPGQGTVVPHFFVQESCAQLRGWKPVERFGYCEVSGHANERTVLAAVVPRFAICGNKVPVLKGVSTCPDDGFFWLALANSLLVDWVMRRFVSTTINQFYWRNVPFPQMTARDRAFCAMAARRISQLQVQAPAEWLGKRAQLRAAVDAVVFKSFGLGAGDRSLILEDFALFGRLAKAEGAASLEDVLEAYAAYVEKEVPTLNGAEKVMSALSCGLAYATREQKRLRS